MRAGAAPVRVAVLGSSGTYGFRVPRDATWPAWLERLARERCRPVEVANFASPGLPLAAYAERLAHLREAHRPDAVVIQLPEVGRAYLGLNGTRRFREEEHEAHQLFGWAGPRDATTRVSPTRIHLTRLLAVPGSPFFHLLEPWFYPRVAENNPEVRWEEFLAFARFWADNVAGSDLQHVQHGKEIVFLQMLLERWRTPYLMFDWHRYNSRRDPRLGRFRELIDFTAYVGGGERTAQDFVEEEAGPAREELFVDAHGHLAEEGHRRLAGEFLLPDFLALLERTTATEGRHP